jgi:hypothetical protein
VPLPPSRRTKPDPATAEAGGSGRDDTQEGEGDDEDQGGRRSKRRRGGEGEGDETAEGGEGNAEGEPAPVPAWAKYESSSTLAFARDMDARVAARMAAAAAPGGGAAGRLRSLKEEAAALEDKLREAQDQWVTSHTLLEPNKKDPSKFNARCSFAWCGKLFKETTFTTKHLCSKHAPHLNFQVRHQSYHDFFSLFFFLPLISSISLSLLLLHPHSRIT